MALIGALGVVAVGCHTQPTEADNVMWDAEVGVDSPSIDVAVMTDAVAVTDAVMADSASSDGDADIDWGLEVEALSSTCPEPPPTPVSPLAMLGRIDVQKDPMGIVTTHIIDVDRDPTNGRYYAVGLGGGMVFEDTGEAPDLLGMISVTGVSELTRLAALGDGFVAVTHRDLGLVIMDATAPSEPRVETLLSYDNASGMAVGESHLYLLLHSGELVTLDITDPSAPVEVSRVEGLGNPWKLAIAGDRAYVADNTYGLVVVNLEQPEAPTLGASVATAGSAQDIDLHEGYAYIANGSNGVQVFSLSAADKPMSVSIKEIGGMAVSVSIDSSVLWVTNQKSVVAMDVTEPSAPFVLDYLATEEWAMHVFAEGSDAMVGAWGWMERYTVDASTVTPVAETSVAALSVAQGESQVQLQLINRGGAELILEGMAVDDLRFTPSYDARYLASGEEATIQLSFQGDGAEVEAELCLVTNSPGHPVLKIPITSTTSGASLALGDQAPAFSLYDTSGTLHSLSDHLGQPVLLVYFATW